jgi:hypothetical protein
MPRDIAKQTFISSYKIVFEATADNSVPTAFPFGVTTGSIDLLDSKWKGSGEETKSNEIELLFTGKPAGSFTCLVTGASEAGPEEAIASLAVTIGSVVETGDWRIGDTIDMTSYHLAPSSIVVADSGNSRVAKFGADMIGYRYINFYISSLTTTTNLRIYARSL